MCPTRLSSLPGVASVPGGGGGDADAGVEGVAGGREAVDGIVSATLEASDRKEGAGEGGETPHAVSGREEEPWWEGLCSKK